MRILLVGVRVEEEVVEEVGDILWDWDQVCRGLLFSRPRDDGLKLL